MPRRLRSPYQISVIRLLVFQKELTETWSFFIYRKLIRFIIMVLSINNKQQLSEVLSSPKENNEFVEVVLAKKLVLT